jgi:putative transposase
MVRYVGRGPDDLALRKRLEKLAAERRRFGFRRLTVLLRREGIKDNVKRGVAHCTELIGSLYCGR